jgi:glycosyltransferase involved in cell wall biosynthesis
LKKKTILHLITTIERGGAEKQLLVLVSQQILFGFNVEVVYLKGEPELQVELEKLGASVRNEIANQSFYRQIFGFHRLIHDRGRYIVHAHLPKSELLAALVCRKSHFIVTRHNTEPFWPKGPRIFSTFISLYVSYKAAGVIAISQAVSKYLLDSKEIHSIDKIRVIRYGFDPKSDLTLFEPPAFPLPNAEKLNSIRIGTIGRLVPQKDYPTLLKAFSELLKIDRRPILYIIGEGFLEVELRQLCVELSIEENVYFLGKTENVLGFLDSIDLFVLASKYEGFGLVLLEAMSREKPIVAANNSAIPEVLGENYSGLFQTSNQHELTQKLVSAIQLRTRLELKKELNDRLEIFTPQKMAQNIHAFYSEKALL